MSTINVIKNLHNLRLLLQILPLLRTLCTLAKTSYMYKTHVNLDLALKAFYMHDIYVCQATLQRNDK